MLCNAFIFILRLHPFYENVDPCVRAQNEIEIFATDRGKMLILRNKKILENVHSKCNRKKFHEKHPIKTVQFFLCQECDCVRLKLHIVLFRTYNACTNCTVYDIPTYQQFHGIVEFLLIQIDAMQ